MFLLRHCTRLLLSLKVFHRRPPYVRTRCMYVLYVCPSSFHDPRRAIIDPTSHRLKHRGELIELSNLIASRYDRASESVERTPHQRDERVIRPWNDSFEAFFLPLFLFSIRFAVGFAARKIKRGEERRRRDSVLFT